MSGSTNGSASSHLNGSSTTSPDNILDNVQSLQFMELLYEQYLQSPSSLSDDWQAYFRQMKDVQGAASTQRIPSQRSIFNPSSLPETGLRRPDRLEVAGRQERLDQLIRNYRVRGHIMAELDPLGTTRKEPAELSPEFYGFTEEDLNSSFSTSWFGGPSVRTLREMLQWLRTTYCRSIGVQFMHIDSLSVREWLQSRMETTGNSFKLSVAQQQRILKRLSDAVHFEEFLHTKFIGEKSFSLDGGESLIPLLDMAIEKSADQGVKEIVIGMAHRGRLNVLANILGKNFRAIFREFVDQDPELQIGRGDVKYHLGYSSDWTTEQGNEVHLSLCFNPSHLEYINPVAQGRLRAKMDMSGDTKREKGLCILVHGDAAFAGEGVVQETLNMSELNGYNVGGTLHIILNNQVGFTTDPSDARSTTYATDVAKMLQVPIFHVNGEDPAAVAQVVRMALDFREKYQRDVVIDMYCYRKFGHNESDEPEFTQPLMYKNIKKRKSIFENYLDSLLALRGITKEEADQIVSERKQILDKELEIARKPSFIRCVDDPIGVWKDHFGGSVADADQVETAVSSQKLKDLAYKITDYPSNFTPHRKLIRILEQRREMGEGKRKLDWGTAELLAFASLIEEGHPFRMSGQDVERGTFSQRHAVFSDFETGNKFRPLQSLAKPDGIVEMYNSPLSEAGVLGFDYGYSLDCPDGLVIWEAQFGDFCNAAQVIIDQFIVSAEDKWHRFSSLVMMLPHGFEGQGPEHSSARLERFLMLAAEDNFQICNSTTPAQHFHLLRRQVLRKWKKPLVLMTPKSLLRLPAAGSDISDLANGTYQEVLDDPVTSQNPDSVQLVLLCSGKVYYDLVQNREERQLHNVAIVRLEQIYPIPFQQLADVLSKYPDGTTVRWVQEEPENSGASRFLRLQLGNHLFNKYPFESVERSASASPATGSKSSHKMEQSALMEEAFMAPN